MKAPESYYSQEDLILAAKATEKILEGGKITLEMSLITKDGRKIPYEYTATALKGSDGSELIVSVGRDVSERKEAERRIQYQAQLVENVSDAIISTDLDFNIITWNKAAERIYGWKVEEVVGKNLNDIIPVFYPYNEEEEVLKSFYENGFWNGEVIQYRKDRNHINILTSVSLIKDISNIPIGTVGINRDITQRKKIEENLRESEEKFRKIFETIPDLFFLVSADTTILDYKGNLEELYLPPDEFLGKKMNVLLPPNIAKLSSEAIKNTLETQKFHIVEYNLELKDSLHYFEARHLYFSDDRVLVFIRNITERKRIEEQIYGLSKFPSENPNPVLRVGKERILYSNKAGQTLLEISEGSEVPEFLKMKINQAYDDNISHNFEYEINRKIYFFNIVPFIQEGYTNIYGRDITERKRAEKKIKESEENFRALYEDAPIAYFSIGKNQSILRSNHAAERLLGYTKKEFGNMRVIDLYSDTIDGKEKAKNVFQKFLKGESIQDLELQMINKQGDPIWISLAVKPILDSKGNVIESRSMALDITDRKKAERALELSEKRYREAYDRANFYKDLFAHDMNNILQVVNSSAELISFQLGDSEKSKNIANIASIVKKQVERGAKLISNVRTLSELEEMDIIFKRAELNEFIRKAIDFVERAYEGRNINISYKRSDREQFTSANELLQDVFENVLINAIKYNENPSIEISIKISKQKVEGKDLLKIEFNDNGIGVSDERKDVIFTSGNRELKGSKGMGLGLSLVSKILNIFKGKIWVEDKIRGDYTKGSNFIIILPEVK
jgi:PAS domain S-box-containing protein